MTGALLQGDARRLPLADNSVDLISHLAAVQPRRPLPGVGPRPSQQGAWPSNSERQGRLDDLEDHGVTAR